MARFGCVGVAGMAVNFGVLWLLAGQAHLPLVAASVLATEAAIINNFLLNNAWTFRSLRDQETHWRKLVKYNTFALGGMALSVTTLWVLTHYLGLFYLLANVAAVGVALVWNYAANRRWTWSGQTASPVAPVLTPHRHSDAPLAA